MVTASGRIGSRVVTWPWHPPLVAAFFVLFLFAENAVQQVTLAPLWIPLGVSLIGAVAVALVCSAPFRDYGRGGLLATLLLVAFFSFGHAWNLVRGIIPHPAILAAAYLLLVVAGGILVWRGGRWVPAATRFLNAVILLLVAVNGLRIGQFVVGAEPVAAGPGAEPLPGLEAQGRRPDIYYIILDRYANSETLERIYGFDNEPFLSALEERGFTAARDAWANYYKTALSVLSSMNMDYLDAEALDRSDPPNWSPTYAALRDHLAVPVNLKSLGYEYIHLASYWEPTSTNVDADLVLRFQDHTEFNAALMATTALVLLEPLDVPDDDPETIAHTDLARETTLFTFDKLEESAGRPGPTFVFAHLLVPHPPYVFARDGSMPTEEEQRRPENAKYLDQLQWGNQRVLEAIDRLLDVPPGEEPIIILQADEGPYPPPFQADPVRFNWLLASEETIQQKFGILNAYHLPGMDPQQLGVHDRTSPVNAFRIVLNAYFGADLPLLPDVPYLTPSFSRLYDFVPYERDDPPG